MVLIRLLFAYASFCAQGINFLFMNSSTLLYHCFLLLAAMMLAFKSYHSQGHSLAGVSI